MEAEISAATLLDDNPDSPFALMSSASSSSLRHRKHEDEESLSETLPENLVSGLFVYSFAKSRGSNNSPLSLSLYGDIIVVSY